MQAMYSYKLVEHINNLNDACKRAYANTALTEVLGGSVADALRQLNELFHGTADEISRSNFSSEERRQAQLDKLESVRQEVMNALFSRGGVKSIGPLISDAALERIIGIAELISEKDISQIALVDRGQIMSATEELLSDIMEWDIDKYCRDALILKINAVQRIVQTSTNPSALEVREKVREIIADFSVEFQKMDKIHQRQLERLATWAGSLFKKGERILGLALLSKETLALAAPVVRQITSG